MRGVAVVPAAVQPPDVAHDELRLIVVRLQVRTAGQRLRGFHGVDDLVEAGARVHHLQGLLDQAVQVVRRVGQRLPYSARPGDGQAVAGQQHLRVQGGHLPQRDRPLVGVPLHLLRVPGVRGDPDEQVTGQQHAALWQERPGGVVGLAARVVHLEGDVAERDPHLVAVRQVGLPVGRRPGQAGEAELPLVDHRVVARRPGIPGEPGGDVLVRDDARAGAVLGVEGVHARDVVEVPVGEDGVADWLITPGPHGRVHVPRVHVVAGVEQSQAAIAPDAVDVAERGPHDHAVGHLLHPPRAQVPQRHLLRGHRPAPNTVRMVEDRRCHGASLSRTAPPEQ